MRLHLNFETVASVCAIITSVIALFVAWDQSVVMRAQQHASVWPIVISDATISQNETQNYIEFNVSNVGVGPAIIRDSKLYFNDKLVEHFSTFQEQLFVGSQKESLSGMFASFNGVLGAGESKTALKLWWPRNDVSDADFVAMVEQFVASDSRFAIEQCYCSVFERCFVSTNEEALGPQEVASCQVGKDEPVDVIKATMQ
ncbi:hypothetical protein [Planctobacterium marinum]|uniref:Uncharacterized protein n=1 Tax=Planctobacterium marinum TaxID=1631968 RepID=A0AA48I571_9ALTE|nr:hypothetical protein MACH26_16560 [Planctobacterium marinum]